MISDGLLLVGSLGVVAGAWLAWPPLGLIVGGVVLAFWGLFFEYLHLQRKKRAADAGTSESA